MLHLNLYAVFVACLPLLYALWIKTHPYEALKMLAFLKRKLRQWIIRRRGEEAFKILTTMMMQKAGASKRKQKAVKILMKLERKRIVKEFGEDYANWSLGHPGPIERDF